MEQIRKGSAVFPASPWWPLGCKAGCMYRAGEDGGCNYILVAGKMRGCEPGKDCTRYRRRAAARKKEDITLGGPDKRKGARGQWDHEKGYGLWKDGRSMQKIADELKISKKAVQFRKEHYWVFGRA